MRSIICFILMSTSFVFSQPGSTFLNGRILNSSNNEPVSDCVIMIKNSDNVFYSDIDGNFHVRLRTGRYEIQFMHIAYERLTKIVSITDTSSSQLLSILLKPLSFIKDEITVTAKREYPTSVVQKLTNNDVVTMPNVYSDVLRSVQTLAGVSSNNELTSSYNVRGGSADENLIYLNGYEIYRPMLLKQGVEENQSIINPDMVKSLRFSNGAFSAVYGDKMSSALDVDYVSDPNSKLKGNVRLDFMNAGLTIRKGYNNASVILGARLAYPKMFLGGLQTKGDYNPSFSDVQLFSTFRPTENSNIEIMFIYNHNKYDVTPSNWLGHFNSDRSTGLASAIELVYHGSKYYYYYTGLSAIKYSYSLLPAATVSTSYSQYWSGENETGDVSGDVYYYPNADILSASERDFIKTRYEKSQNSTKLLSRQIKTDMNIKFLAHLIDLGGELRLVGLDSDINEFFQETGKLSLQTLPLIKSSRNHFDLNSLSLYANDAISILPSLRAEVGARLLIYKYTKERLFSPRAALYYYLDSSNTFSLNTGLYYQPPFFNEFNGTDIDYNAIKSQRSFHSVLGWERIISRTLSLQVQAFYKKLDRLIPFYYEELKMIYSGGNVNEGYAYGFDLMLKGRITKGTDSWLGYSFLHSRERRAGADEPYKRRLFDQTHTIQIFLQDQFRKHPNWQSHLRLLAGSGFLFYNKGVTTDPASGKDVMYVDYQHPEEFLFYLRADMGLSARFEFDKGLALLAMVEVLNVFDKRNFAGYDFMMVFPDYKGTVRIPRILSSRFLNLKVTLSF
ncbi:MAG: carboxypeptidase-like regulatory domain-containing protein [Ignavibacteriales bacterium]